MAEFRANIQRSQKKRAAEQRKQEAQKREAEKESRKNLVGVRVVQKNLVYVTGLAPTGREDELLRTLRRNEFFGQYGNILKISISNRKGTDGQNGSLGIYVTFEKKEDAQKCIAAVNGSANGERTLKAQLGTTKYCSTWLRNENCTNRQCMFLHEQGDDEDSYTRQDLSSLNSIGTQQRVSNPASSSSRSASRQQMQQPAAPSMVRSSSKDGSEDDGSALPSSANWARNPQVQSRSRRGSYATSGAASSPAITMSLPATAESAMEDTESAIQEEPAIATPPVPDAKLAEPIERSKPTKTAREEMFERLFQAMAKCPEGPFKRLAHIDPQAYFETHPPMFDPRGGEKRRARLLREEEEARLAGEQEEQSEAADTTEDGPENSGSLALGGEPEDRDHARDVQGSSQRRGSAMHPYYQSGTGPGYGTIGNRTVTPQQSVYSRAIAPFSEQMPPGLTSQANLFQGQGHSRQSSRFNFGDSAANATSVKLSANPRIMAQQSAMMPSALHSQQGSAYYASSMPGPPPGLKSTGTPPGAFGQGHSFGGTPGFGGAVKDNSQHLQDIVRLRGSVSSQAHDANKREYLFPSFSDLYPPFTSTPASGFPASLYGNPSGAFLDAGLKRAKKGKKHRHANTSSSGGGALVELADPSILRMQHPQSNAGAGQGLFGGQTQGGYSNPAMMYNGGYPRW
jgi:CCR4-NOT transcription complex subunit 4